MSQATPAFLVVGIGASAGGVEALQAFFANVPASSGCAYVVILHLSPEHDSQLPAIIQHATALPVTAVTERVQVEPNHIYVVAPSQHLTMVDGHIHVSPTTLPEERRAPIDIFFRTLAETHDARAVCVLLSGTGSDGSMGLKRVKERGGAVFVQNPREATFGEMPRSAIATNLVDTVLPVAAIPARIVAYQAALGTVAIPVEPDQRPEAQQQALREIFAQLRLRTGHDFANYKRPTLLRRIERRISVRGLPDLPAYAAYLGDHPDEVQALLKDLLISVTNFFRDPEAFAALEHIAIPRLFAGRSPEQPVRVWVVGCATGEEAYSVAMLCAEHTLDTVDAPPVQIFATDIDEAAIAHARAGLYTISDTADVSPERLRRFFSKEDDRYRVRRELRELVLFANHNVLKDPPFSHLDLITCRNVLIYLNRSAQERVLETLHFALEPGGYLFLGSAESVDGANDLFGTVSREQHLYQRRPSGPRTPPVPALVPTPRILAPRLQAPSPEAEAPARAPFSASALHQRLLEQYAPPSLVVNQEYDILHLSERAGRYLQVAGGAPSTNLLALVRPELRLPLRTALGQATQRQTNVEARGLPLRVDERTELVNIHVRPVLRADDPAQGVLLVLFEAERAGEGDAEPVYRAEEPVARQLEEEVLRLKEQLRSSSEQYEFQTEELRATNEELQALNEELRSSTEELETSKEELQSINEELRTVNQELKVKVDEATLTSANLQNLVNSADIGTIFLDRGLRVRLFTPAARALFNLIPADHGRSLSDITHRLIDVDVQADSEAVLATLQTVEREVRSTEGRVYVLRVLPYRAAEDRIGGVVITFFDITERKLAEEALQASEEQFRRALEDAPIPVIMHAEDGQVLQISRSWTELTGYTIDDVPTFDAWLNRAYGEGADAVRAHVQGLFTGEKRTLNLLFDIRTRAGELRHWSFSASSPGALRDGRRYIVGMAVDITERARAERVLAEQARLLDQSNDALRASEARQTFLLQLGDALRDLAEPGAIQDQATRILGRHLGVARVHYGEVTDDDAHIVFEHHYTNGAPVAMGRFRMADFGPSVVAALRAGHTIVMPDVAASPALSAAEREANAAAGVAAQVGVPLIKAGRFVAILAVHHTEPRAWSPQEVSLIEEVAQRTWAAVERARAEAALRESEERFRLMVEGARDYAMFLLDPQNRISFWSAGAARVFGWTEDEALGQPGDIIFTQEDREAGAPAAEVATAVGDGSAVDRRWHVTRDGGRLFIDGVLIRLDDAAGALRGFVKIGRDATAQRLAEEAVAQANADLEARVQERTAALVASNRVRQELLRQLVTAQEEERLRLARDLHDQLGQQITGLLLGLKQLEGQAGDGPLGPLIPPLQDLALELAKEVHRLAMNLRPTALDDVGLVPALERLVADWGAQTGVAAAFHGQEQARLPAALETTLYRVVQEALTNVHKHAGAARVSVLLERRPGEVVAIVEDDGGGYDPEAAPPDDERPRLGLRGMRERVEQLGGTLEIETAPGNGTTVFARLPLDAHEPAP